jgi:hypothetical protein
MTAEELANKFKLKVAAAVVEKDRQEVIAHDNEQKRTADMDHCRRAMEAEVVPFLEEVKHHFGEDQFSYATQIERNDHRPVGVSFIVGNGAATSITTAFGNIVVTQVGDSDLGTVVGIAWTGVTISWDDGHTTSVTHNDMGQVERASVT